MTGMGIRNKMDSPPFPVDLGTPISGFDRGVAVPPPGGRPVDALSRQSSRQDSGHFRMEFFATLDNQRDVLVKYRYWLEMSSPTSP